MPAAIPLTYYPTILGRANPPGEPRLGETPRPTCMIRHRTYDPEHLSCAASATRQRMKTKEEKLRQGTTVIGWKVIPQGERVLVWNRVGQARIVDGPQRLVLWGDVVQPLERHTAGPEEFLVVVYKNGRKEHVRGPAAT